MEKTVSTTDPDAGMPQRPGKPEGIRYLDHQSVGAAHGIVADVAMVPGSASGSEPCLGRVEYTREHMGLETQEASADSVYGTSTIYQAMEGMGIRLHTPGEAGKATYKVELRCEDFRYDAGKDCLLCPWGEELTLRSLERESYSIYRTYRAGRKDCQACLMPNRCVNNSHQGRIIRKNTFEEAVKRQQKTDDAFTHKRILGLRWVWYEGSFVAQKWMYNLRCLFRRGIEAARDYCLPSATALNLKQMIKCLGQLPGRYFFACPTTFLCFHPR